MRAYISACSVAAAADGARHQRYDGAAAPAASHRRTGCLSASVIGLRSAALLSVWFILGNALYATVLGALCVLASRMEEASNVSTSVTAVAFIAYFVAIFAVSQDPSRPIAIVATFLPPTAPFIVPMRAAFDAIQI